MTTTTYYNLNIVEGTDIVNPLTVDNPNYEKIDEELHNNAVSGVTLATEIANATVHAITRENSDCAVIRFIATSRWKAGDTATVDGVPVTALLPNGETLPDGAYVINANVLCILTGTNLTVYLGEKKAENANEISYHETNVEAELDGLNASLEEVNGSIDQINANLGRITNLQTNIEVKVGTFGGKDLFRKIIIKDFRTTGESGIIHMFDETILPENAVSINGICLMVEENTCQVIPNNKILLNINSSGKIYAMFTENWTLSTYTWRYKLDVLYTK